MCFRSLRSCRITAIFAVSFALCSIASQRGFISGLQDGAKGQNASETCLSGSVTQSQPNESCRACGTAFFQPLLKHETTRSRVHGLEGAHVMASNHQHSVHSDRGGVHDAPTAPSEEYSVRDAVRPHRVHHGHRGPPGVTNEKSHMCDLNDIYAQHSTLFGHGTDVGSE